MPHARYLSLPTDARTVVGGIVSLLVLLLIVTQWTGPEARIQRVLQRLPAGVEAVAIDGGPPPLRRLVASLLAFPPRPLPDDVPAVVDLVLTTEGRERRVALIEPAVARAAGLSGSLVRGFTAVGDADAVALLQTAAAPPADGVPAAFRRLAAADAAPDIALVLRRPFITRRLDPSLVPDTALAAAVRAVGTRVAVKGVLDAALPFLGARGGTVLDGDLPGALAVLDGIPASELLPVPLPPILEAIKADTGVGDAIDAVRAAVGDAPLLLVVLPGEAQRADLVVGATVHGSRVAAVAQALRAALDARLRRVGAVTERTRANGRTILHRRSGAGSGGRTPRPAQALIEFDRDGWRVLRAPQAAGSTDLVVAQRGGSVLIGSAEPAVMQVAAAMRAAPQARTAHAAVNLAAARTLPVFGLLERGASPVVRAWLSSIDQGTLTLDGSRGDVQFDLDVTFARPLEELPLSRETTKTRP